MSTSEGHCQKADEELLQRTEVPNVLNNNLRQESLDTPLRLTTPTHIALISEQIDSTKPCGEAIVELDEMFIRR